MARVPKLVREHQAKRRAELALLGAGATWARLNTALATSNAEIPKELPSLLAESSDAHAALLRAARRYHEMLPRKRRRKVRRG